MNKILQKAIEYAAHGYSVMPVGKDKRPLLKSWKIFQQTPAAETILHEWFAGDANIGIITGAVSGITVVDIDTSGPQVVPLATFPKTFTVKTPTGGYHLYYTYDKRIGQTANTFPQFPHVDIRNDGGFVVAPPSVCTYTKQKKLVTGTYTVEKKLPLAPFPYDLFVKAPEKLPIKTLLKGFPKFEEGDGRNVALTKVAGKIIALTAKDDYEAVALPAIRAVNETFKKPLPDQEIRTIFASITARESKKPLASVEFLTDDKGVIVNAENVYRILKHDPLTENAFRYNVFDGVAESNFGVPDWEPIDKVHFDSVTAHIQRTYDRFRRVQSMMVEAAARRRIRENHVSPPKEWLSNLVWDRTPRLDQWLMKTFNVEDSEYHRAVGANWLKGLVKRIVVPGCKFDYVLVLEGRQGIGKSTSLATLGGSWYVETVFAPDNKDFFMLFAGKAIIEFSEGETLSRTESKHLKAIITMQKDKYRPPYGMSSKEFPRQCVFAMTTNQDQYLKDETGNRRWLPVACVGHANIDWLKENREQLFAEAYHRVITLSETVYEFPSEELLAQQDLRRITDPREEQVAEWYFRKLGDEDRALGITTMDAYRGAIQNASTFYKEMSRLDEMQLGGILRNIMLMDRKRTMVGGARVYRYFPSEATMAMAPVDYSRTTQDPNVFKSFQQ